MATLKDVLQLARHQPTRVVVELNDGTTRELRPAKDTRKRWTPILEPLAALPWLRAELYKGDITLAVVNNPEVEQPAPARETEEVQCCVSCGRPVGSDDLDRIIRAQEVALAWQDKSVQRAAEVTASTIDQLRDLLGNVIEFARVRLSPAQHAQAPANDSEEGSIVSVLPALARKLLGDGSGDLGDQLTPERLAKLGSFLDSIPAPAPAPQRTKHAPAAAAGTASKPSSAAPAAAAGTNGANGAAH